MHYTMFNKVRLVRQAARVIWVPKGTQGHKETREPRGTLEPKATRVPKAIQVQLPYGIIEGNLIYTIPLMLKAMLL